MTEWQRSLPTGHFIKQSELGVLGRPAHKDQRMLVMSLITTEYQSDHWPCEKYNFRNILRTLLHLSVLLSDLLIIGIDFVNWTLENWLEIFLEIFLELVTAKYFLMTRLQVEVFIRRISECDCFLTERDSQGDQTEGEEQRGRAETPPECRCEERWGRCQLFQSMKEL